MNLIKKETLYTLELTYDELAHLFAALSRTSAYDREETAQEVFNQQLKSLHRDDLYRSLLEIIGWESIYDELEEEE